MPTMLGVWSLLLLWGLVTPCQGLLETVGTLARIDKDELGKGEPKVGQDVRIQLQGKLSHR